MLRILGPSECVAEATKIVESLMIAVTKTVPLGVILLLELSKKELGVCDIQSSTIAYPSNSETDERRLHDIAGSFYRRNRSDRWKDG